MVREYRSGMLVSRRDDVLAERVLDETVLLDPSTGRYVRLNATGTLLWEALPATLDALAARLAESYELEPARAHADAASFVDSLAERDVLRVASEVDEV
jgi:hypothetical protein